MESLNSYSFDNIFGRVYQKEQTNHTRTICVACIPPHFNDQNLTALFSGFGEIESIKVVRDHATRRSKRHAYVRFKENQSANDAMQMEGFDIERNIISVRLVPDSIFERRARSRSVISRGRSNRSFSRGTVGRSRSPQFRGRSRTPVRRRSRSRSRYRARTRSPQVRGRSYSRRRISPPRSPLIRRSSFQSEARVEVEVDLAASVIIEGISPTTQEINIGNFMSSFGTVADVKMSPADCSARVQFSSSFEAKQASMHDTIIGSHGQLITVRLAVESAPEHYDL